MERSDPDFVRLVAHYRPHVDAYVRRRIHHDAADDVVAETFATAWRRRDDLPDDGLPWLYATARYVVGTRYRSDTRWALLAERLTAVPSEPTPDAAVQITERDALVTALATLSDEDRELVLLVIWEGLEVREAATSLGISAGAAATRLHRARARLRAALTDDAAHAGAADARTSSAMTQPSTAARPNPAPAPSAGRSNPADEAPSALDADLEADR
ncbi:MAG: RNA polymerase sigma factor [Acidimicrobiales bacterium]